MDSPTLREPWKTPSAELSRVYKNKDAVFKNFRPSAEFAGLMAGWLTGGRSLAGLLAGWWLVAGWLAGWWLAGWLAC